jgi:TPR repeat protein
VVDAPFPHFHRHDVGRGRQITLYVDLERHILHVSAMGRENVALGRPKSMTRADVRIEDDFELVVAEGRAFQTLYVRVADEEAGSPSEIPGDELRRLAVEGSVDAQIGWARRLLHGHGVTRDPEAALRWFKMAARTGDPDALNMVGRCYELGWGVPEDCTQAADWFRRAADKGHAWGKFNLATLYAQGRGVPVDQGQALSLLVRSARRGNAKAMNMLGRYREVVAGRLGAAAFWYRRAAAGGCFRGQFHHGRFLVAAGRIGDGLAWFRTSLSHAPQDFRREALQLLQADARPELRALAAEAEAGERGSTT